LYGPAKLGVAVLGAALLAYLLSPLAVLFLEVLNNPNAISIEVSPIESFPNQTVLVEVTYRHSVTVRFDNLTIRIGNASLSFGDVGEGVYRKNITLPVSSLQEMSGAEISFVLAGIYPVSVEVKGG